MKLPGNKRRLRMVIPIRIIRTMMIHPLMSKKENGQLFRSFFRLILRVCLLYSFWKIKAKKSRKTRLASHTLNSQYCPSPSQQMIPMRRIFSPATSQTTDQRKNLRSNSDKIVSLPTRIKKEYNGNKRLSSPSSGRNS